MATLPFDLSALPAPEALETWTFDQIFQASVADVVARLNAAEIPYNVDKLVANPMSFVVRGAAYREGLMRQRVNDAVRAVLAPLAQKADLDNVCARIGVQRLLIQPATDTSDAIYENDAQLLRRYLLAFDRPAAGSADKYLYEAYTAWPDMLDAAVRGFETHGRRGDIDLVVIGPGGALPTDTQLAAVRAAVNASGVKGEATSMTVMAARRTLFDVSMLLDIPEGPDPATVIAGAEKRVTAAAAERMVVGGQAPLDLLFGAAYGPGVTKVTRIAPAADILPDPYAVPVMTGLSVKRAEAS